MVKSVCAIPQFPSYICTKDRDEESHDPYWNSASGKMSQAFVFPPPPPPPSRTQWNQSGNFSPEFPTSLRGSFRDRGNGFGQGRARADSSRARGRFGRDRGKTIAAGLDRTPHTSTVGLHHGSLNHANGVNRTIASADLNASHCSASTGVKRPFSTAFHFAANNSESGPHAAPSVPSFGGSLLASPPATFSQQDEPAKPSKKSRNYNQLGLTPASQDYQSSSGEDEEPQLSDGTGAAVGSGPQGLLQFECNGRIVVLRTAADVNAWIAERKQKYPTMAKREATKTQTDETEKQSVQSRQRKLQADRSGRIDLDKSKQEQLRRRALESVARKQSETAGMDSKTRPGAEDDGNKSGEPQVAKLRRDLETAQSEAQRANDALFILQRSKMTPQLESVNENDLESKKSVAEGSEDLAMLRPRLFENKEDDHPSDSDVSSISSASSSDRISSWEDDTSSSGSSVVSCLTIGSKNQIADRAIVANATSVSARRSSSCSITSSASHPPELTSRRSNPEHVPSPPHRQSLHVEAERPAAKEMFDAKRTVPCRNIIRFGSCRHGQHCRYSHDPAIKKRLENKKDPKTPNSSSIHQRKSLYRVLVEKEIQEERTIVLKAIIELGRDGMLDPPLVAKGEQEAPGEAK